MFSDNRSLCRWCAILVATGFVTALAAQPPSPSIPGVPKLQSVEPTGIARGATLEVKLAGSNLSHPIALGHSFPARATTATEEAPGKDSTKSAWKLEIGENAAIGMYRLRMLTSQGLSNAKVFCVDSLTPIVSSGVGRAKESAQVITVPCVVAGRIAAESSEFFRFSVSAGQVLSFEVLGRRLGSAVDPWMRLYDAQSGRELPYAYCDDAPGLQTDPRFTHKFTAAGEYVIEVRDATFRGGPDFHYRLRIGDFPCAIAPLPLAATRGRKIQVQFAGSHLDGVAPMELLAPAEPDKHCIPIAPTAASGIPGWPVTLMMSDIEEMLAPETMPKEGVHLPVPCGITSRFSRKSQVDTFRFAARKGQKYSIGVQTTEFLSPAELVLTVRDPKGAIVAKSDPGKPARLDLAAGEDGQFAIAAEHVNYAFGPNEVYRLTITQPQPGFDLTLGSDSVVLPQGQGALIPIQTLARRDFAGPIELSIVGHKGLSGSLGVTAGAESGPPPGPGQPSSAPFAMLPVAAAADLAPGVYEILVQAKATIDGREFVTFAGTESLLVQAMGGLPFPPREWNRKVAVGVLPKPPFEVAARFEPPEAVRGSATTLVVSAQRDASFQGPIVLSALGLPANVTAPNMTLAPAQSEARMPVKLAERAAMGSYSFTLVGRAQDGERSMMSSLVAPQILVVRPFDLKVEPNPVSITQGEKAQLRVTATRRGGYDGPISIELRNLPAQVSAAKKSVIAQGEAATTIELSAATSAPLGARGDVDALGTIDLAQQQFASSPFAVKVQAPAPTLQLRAEPTSIVLKPGGTSKVNVAIERKHTGGPVLLTLTGLPPNVKASEVTVGADQSAGEIEIVAAAADVAPASVDATLTGKIAGISTAIKLKVQVEKLMDR